MKKIIMLSSILLGVFFLSGCSKQITSQTQPTKPITNLEKTKPETKENNYYTNKDLGIRFTYKSDDFFKGKIKTQANTIIYEDPSIGFSQYIVIFTKKDNQTIEEAILDAVKEKGKDPKNCKVTNQGKYPDATKYNSYILDLANPEIAYTKQELEEIKLADTEAKKDGGPFDGEWKKQEIYNKRLVENCSDYADPLGLGTSKSTSSRFIYNNKNKFIFLPGLHDQPFYQEESIEIFN